MAVARIVTSQTDFSSGEVDPALIRDESNPVTKSGLRQCRNFRILDAKGLANRHGRSAKFIDGPRVDEVLMAPGQTFYLVFRNGALAVRNAAGAVVFTAALKGDGVTAIPWTSATAQNLVWVKVAKSIYITYADGAPANVPQVLTWDGAATWTLATYAEMVAGSGTGGSGGGGTSGGGGSLNATGGFAPGAGFTGNTKRTPFYRISPLSITMQPSARTGPGITLTFSAGMNLVAGHVGTRMRFCGAQLLITAVGSALSATATAEEVLPGSQAISCVPNPSGVFSVGQVVEGSVTGARGLVISIADPVINVQLVAPGNSNSGGFATSDNVVGPGGAAECQSANPVGNPLAVAVWDDEVMNAFRGYPQSVFFDNDRLGFCDLPSVPRGIVWSSIATPTDLYVPPLGVVPASAIMEVVPSEDRVRYVLAGAQSSEFVFCENAVYEIPISAANPFSGTVGATFLRITDDGCYPVQPRLGQNTIIYINAGGSSVRGIMTTGAYNRANESRDISEFHNHLFTAPIAIASPNADGPFPERYVYVLNADGTAVQGKYDISNGELKGNAGWAPVDGNGFINWISARGPDVMFDTAYAGASGALAELLDSTQYLDAAIPYNAVPAALTPPGGKGPLWWMPAQTCTVMDVGTRQMGLYTIDANGFLIPQGFGSEDLTSAHLVVGQAWIGTIEPIVPSPGPGQDVKQRLLPRAIATAMAYVQNSTGFLWARLFSGPLTPDGPALGDVMGEFRVPTYMQGDDATQPAPEREDAFFYEPTGTSNNPRIAIIKDTSGPLTICEIATEVTV